jgi:hypothetical protein
MGECGLLITFFDRWEPVIFVFSPEFPTSFSLSTKGAGIKKTGGSKKRFKK